MILTRYLYREIINTSIALVSILVLIFLSTRFIRYLTEAGAGVLASDFIFKLLSLKILVVMGMILPLAFFLALLLVLGRMSAEQEVVSMAACGSGLPFLLRKINGLALGFGLAVGLLSLYVLPWANHKQELLLHEARNLAQVTGITAGRFTHFDRGRGFFFVEQIQADADMRGIFVALDQRGKKVLLASESGYQHQEPGDNARYVVMENGYRYQGSPGQMGASTTRFSKHTVRINLPLGTPPAPIDATPTIDLWLNHDLKSLAELQARLSVPLALMLLAPIGVLLSHTRPRQSRYFKVFIAILIYFAYRNLLQVSQAWVERGHLPVEIGLWWVHGAALLLLGGLLFARRRA